ncbi:MAG: DUF4442 domain-containing protein [Deltaproteobacteria bacterium]|nr:DUF4442 domain-containing protein [Deltaproteobacteria bacterium]
MKLAQLFSSLRPPKGGAIGGFIRTAWDRLEKVPGGRALFSQLAGRAAPYSGSIGARVEELGMDHARVSMRDRRAVRNHLDCIHAIALANLAELTGNMALAYSMPPDARFIVAGMEIEYVKKARGTIRASCDFEMPRTHEKREYRVPVELRDRSGDIVVRATLRTLVGPIEKRSERERGANGASKAASASSPSAS